YNGYQIWDISNPAEPQLETAYLCPASQSDVSVYRNLLFVSGEGLSGRIDCGTEGVKDTVSAERLRGLRIFDISDMAHPKNVGNVQTCRGSHTHTVLVDPKQAAIVSSPRIFNNLVAPPRHGEAPEDIAAAQKALAEAKAKGEYTADIMGQERPLPSRFTQPMLDSIVKARGGTGPATAADSATLRQALPGIVAKMFGGQQAAANGPRPGPTQCHDITVYPAVGLAGGACEGYGMLLDIRDPAHPVRLDAVRLELLLLALGDVQQRRHEGAVLRRVGRRRSAEVPRHRSARMGRRCALHDRERQDAVPGLLQAPGAADGQGELRGAQWLAHCHSGARRHGAGVVSGRHLGVRLDRPGTPARNRVLRPRPHRLDAHGGRRLLVGLLVQWCDRELGDRARAR